MPETAFLCDKHFRPEELCTRGNGRSVEPGTLPIQQDWRTVASFFFGTDDESKWGLDPATCPEVLTDNSVWLDKPVYIIRYPVKLNPLLSVGNKSSQRYTSILIFLIQ